jgi:hypothetical protein
MGDARGTRQLGLLFVLSYASALFFPALRRRYMRVTAVTLVMPSG